MKIRNGFVSNSSSSSFCIIGVDDARDIRKLLKAEDVSLTYYDDQLEEWVDGNDYLSYGMCEGKVVTFHGSDEPNWAGIPAEPILETRTLREARQYFSNLVKKELNVDILPSAVDLHYGEAGNG